MSINFEHSIQKEGIRIQMREKLWLFNKRFVPPASWSQHLGHVSPMVAGGILALLDSEDEETIRWEHDGIVISHEKAAQIDNIIANALSMPPMLDRYLSIKHQKLITDRDFKFTIEWIRNEQPAVNPILEGAFIKIGEAWFRVPEPLYSIVNEIEAFNAGDSDDDLRYAAIANIQNILGEKNKHLIDTDDYLKNIRVHHASAFSLGISEADKNDIQFIPILFAEDKSKNTPDEKLLNGNYNEEFAEKFFMHSKAKNRYVLEDGSVYVYLDPHLHKALSVVHKLCKEGNAKERHDFFLNPCNGILSKIPDMQESDINALFVEIPEYSDRVSDIAPWIPPVIPWIKKEAEEWLPESFGIIIGNIRVELEGESVEILKAAIKEAIEKGESFIEWEACRIPANEKTLEVLAQLITIAKPNIQKESKEEKNRIIAMVIKNNFCEKDYYREMKHRLPLPENEPTDLKSTLKPHQHEGIEWMRQAWNCGLSGVLLADDMGLGKTIQALCLLSLIRQLKAYQDMPLLTVAPTGLIENWLSEHEHHFRGETISHKLRIGGIGKPEIIDGKSDSDIVNRIKSQDWVLTSYETLRNYQHSFAAVKFSAVVFDEMQKIKTPNSLITHAAKSLNADFILGMTGTPVENRLADLWCLIDAIEPGTMLGDLQTFSNYYEKETNEEKLRELHEKLTSSVPSEENITVPAVMLRRLKSDAGIETMPAKHENILTETMPDIQSSAYDTVVYNAKEGRHRKGGILKSLHKLRSVCLHPQSPDQWNETIDNYSSMSARISKMLDILDTIKKRDEKSLVFLESLDMQPIVAQIIQRRYKMPNQPMIINGQVAGSKRLERVKKFQKNEGFDTIILSPRAAGVGLTLTAANHVIHLSRWWNPAVEDQCTGRAHRIGQEKDVHCYYLLAKHPIYKEGSFDCRLHALLMKKRKLSEVLLTPSIASDKEQEALLNDIIANATDNTTQYDPIDTQHSNLADDCNWDWNTIDYLDGEQFERQVIRWIRCCGFSDIKKTPRSHDGGADCLACKNGKTYIFQFKHTQNIDTNMKQEAVDDLLRASKNYEDYKSPILVAVTNARKFNKTAESKAREYGVKLICRTNWETEWNAL